VEAFDSELTGLLEGLEHLPRSSALKRITFVELERQRAQRLAGRLQLLLPEGRARVDERDGLRDLRVTARSLIVDEQPFPTGKPLILVAMPFSDAMSRIYDDGILPAATACGFDCLRADREVLTEDVVQWVKDRISDADLIIADVTGANPNVYLEIGYAWGTGKRTLLVTQDPKQLLFDVRTHGCLVYESAESLEQLLRRSLPAFRSDN
jgi:hypothetical protein